MSNAQALINKITPHGGVAQACVTSINESHQMEFTSYPNPAEDILFVNAPNYQKLQFEVIDILGKLVQKQEINAPDGLFEINISDLHQGIYFVRCISNSQVLDTKKVLVK